MCRMKPKSPIDLHSVGNQDDDHYSPEQAARMLSVPDCVVANLVTPTIERNGGWLMGVEET